MKNSDNQQSSQQQQAIDRLQQQLNQQQNSNKTFRNQESSISNLISNSFTLLKDLKAQNTEITPPVIHGR